VCLAEIEVAHRHKVPYVNTNCRSDEAVEAAIRRGLQHLAVANHAGVATFMTTLATMGVKRVVAFAENTDYGIVFKLTGEILKQKAPQIDYKYETPDRTSKDFTASFCRCALTRLT
jgi:hypothetical protein